ncbi:MAG: ABC transporter permease [Chloroflexi bacterium]|nr:ABC transporter permease [Chloroflexota bacterium]
MQTYIIRRVLINIPVIWLSATLVFFATSVLPGDFVVQRLAQQDPTNTNPNLRAAQIKQIRKELGLDKPLPIRYTKYIGNLVKGDLGTSYQTKRPAIEAVRKGLPYSLQLGLMSLFIAVMTAFPIGIISAIRQDSPVDYVLRVFAIVALAAPNFWVATMFLLYVVRWKLWEISINDQPLFWDDPSASFKLYIIPAIVGGLASGAGIMRLLRSQMLEVLRQDYIRTAWAKGIRERVVISRHALKNAMVPVLTVMGLTIAGLLSGQVVLENIFGIPGVGRKLIVAVTARDVPVVQAFVVVTATFIVFVNLAVDVLYGVLDPRIRYA